MDEQYTSRFSGVGRVVGAAVNFYAYGLSWTHDSRGVTRVGHSGGLPGFGSYWRFSPE